MELHAKSFAAAVLVLLLAARAADGVPLDEEAASASQRRNFVHAVSDVGLAHEEGAGALNEEEDKERHDGPLSWDKLLPHLSQGEQRNSEAALGVRKFKDKWEALTAQIVKQVQASTGNEKVPALLQKLNDPEVRRNLLTAALGAAGMTAAGLMLGDNNLLRQLSIMSLYVTALFQLLKSGATLASKLTTDASGERGGLTREFIPTELAKVFSIIPESHLTAGEADGQ